jgi:hypothetical protein
VYRLHVAVAAQTLVLQTSEYRPDPGNTKTSLVCGPILSDDVSDKFGRKDKTLTWFG